MLILTRHIGETLVFGEDIYCTVLGFQKDNQIRLGISAPLDTAINRAEIFMKVKAEQKAWIEKGGYKEARLTDVFRAHQKAINWERFAH